MPGQRDFMKDGKSASTAEKIFFSFRLTAFPANSQSGNRKKKQILGGFSGDWLKLLVINKTKWEIQANR